MNKEVNPMDKFDFLIGKWKLKYYVPKSFMSDEDTGEGTGEFKRILNMPIAIFELIIDNITTSTFIYSGAIM